MKRLICASAFVALIATLAFFETRAVGQTPVSSPATAPDPHRAMVTRYCVGCHNARAKVGGLALDSLNLQTPANDAATWEKALRKLRGHLMPPPGSPQPPQKDVDSFVAWMENTLDTNAKGPKAGYVPIQRLNRTEYASAVKALIGVDVNEKEILPQDIQVEGFDNIAESLTTSPAFLDQYISAARLLAKAGVGDMRPPISSWSYKAGGNQDPEMPFPPGIRAAMAFTHNFPADGEYRFSTAFDDQSIGLYNRGLQNRTTQVILIDGKVVFKGDIGGAEDLRLANVKGTDGWAQILERFQKIPVKLTAGPHTIILGFTERSHVESEDNVGTGGGGAFGGRGTGAPMANLANPQNNAIEIKGPYNPTGITDSKTRPMIFVCDPKAIGELPCAKQIAQNLAHRAYSRPVTEADLAYLMRFYNEGRLDNQPFDKGVEQIVAAVLASPDFLYRAIDPPAGALAVKSSGAGGEQTGAGGASAAPAFALDDLALASRLSFFLWNQGPDDVLLGLAERGALHDPRSLDAQVDRMLADPRAETLVTSFALKWLNVDDLTAVVPDAQIFPEFSDGLRTDFASEIELFLKSVLLDNHDVRELLTSDQTFLDERLARHYGVTGIHGPQFRRVKLDDPARFGLLGKGAVLLRTSYGDRTSPVLRGAWVLDKLMGTPPTPPPPNVVVDLTQKAGEKPKTLRARLERHRTDAVCSGCHSVIDPYGLALENFTVTGQWRTVDREAHEPIDAGSTLVTGTPVNGPVALRNALLARPDQFPQAVTEKLMMYAIGRKLAYHDMTQVRAIVQAAAKHDYRFAEIVHGVVRSDAFREQAPPVAPNTAGQTVASN